MRNYNFELFATFFEFLGKVMQKLLIELLKLVFLKQVGKEEK